MCLIKFVRKYDSIETPIKDITYEHQLKFDSKKPRFNHKGWLLADAIIARVGVIDRTDVEKDRKEFISEDELFKQDSLDTITALDIEKVHKSGNDVGVVVGSPYKLKNDNGIFLAVPIAIKDKNAIQDVLNDSFSEVSPEYENIDIPKKSKFDGEEYNFEQINRIYQKIAIVKKGTARGGRHVKVKLDSTDGTDKYLNYREENKSNNIIEKEKRIIMLIDGLDVDIKANEEKIVTKALKDRDEKIFSVQKEKDELQKKYDSLEAKLDEAKETIKKFDSVDHIEKAKKRIELENQLRPILGSDYKFDSKMSDTDLKRAGLTKLRPETDFSQKGEGYIDDRFESIIESEQIKYDSAIKAAEQSRKGVAGFKNPVGNKSKHEQVAEDIIQSLKA